MKRILSVLCLLFFLLSATVVFSSCDNVFTRLEDQLFGTKETTEPESTPDETENESGSESESESESETVHTHEFSTWEVSVQPTCVSAGVKARICRSCGEAEYLNIPKVDHKYDEGKIVTRADCTTPGTVKYSCTYDACNHSYTEAYSLPTYTRDEIYKEAITYVGQITTYNSKGKEAYYGAGFVYTADGKIITNYHILEDAYSATITLNGKKYEIESVLAYNATMDLAIVKINATGLPVAPICKKAVKANETVYAVGVALEFDKSLAYTCLSGTVTNANIEADGFAHIQHDTPITNGNSGGPLLNVYGEVIAINAWRMSGSIKLNFAVFVAELDKLTEIKPITIAELNRKLNDPYELLADWIRDNATKETRTEYIFDNESDDGSVFGISYNIEDDTFTVTFSDEKARSSRVASITFEKDVKNVSCSVTYAWKSADATTCKGFGKLDASTYTISTPLEPSRYLGDEELKKNVELFYSVAISANVEWLEAFLQAIGLGITMEDLGFLVFS